ncbi:MAG: tetratricopeptide repeat protein [Hyphomonadaceae bacterium]
MRALWLAAVIALALAACERTPPDPLAEARATCADIGAEAEARISACTSLIESGELGDPERSAALSGRGDAAYEAGDVTMALRDYTAALGIDASAPAALKGRAAILIESGQLDAAEPLVQRLIEADAFPGEAHYYAGVIAQQRGNVGAATEAYDASIAADQFAPAYAARASIKQAQQDYAGALDDYNAALRINGQLTPALAGRCWTRVLMEEGDLNGARADADAAAQADPRNVEAQLCRGLLQLRAGEWADARASYEAALESEPGNPSALFGRGVARRRSGDSDGREDMNQARDFDRHVARRFDDLGVDTF